ncbi:MULTISPECIES: D-alanyl-D-alanine carboxypeptidase family protein [unclassified Romboutsia]|uniref:D-alanyl-D-alanine carboxypeptidase family protein n=1 Tax=unclassified Romboutsia TaxID=2626894 RepID=UPI0008214AD8|nr:MULTISPECIES: D-alanyl-D-alanine carboxypeptidase family protein [unclassified Romboutsia]SCH51664.1 D-alanyl-D-alanine carboxypeptidase dacC precursor [uncultured Clostridium sp.]
MKKGAQKLLILIIILTFVTPTNVYALDKIDKYSKSSILIDQDTGRVLYEKEPDAKRPLASLSKMMTFLIAIEAIENKEVNANDIVKIDKNIAKVRGSSYHLKEGEEVPLIELMKGLMIVSGNDASIGIARHICKDEKAFVQRMNKRAKELGMVNTYFVNPNGLPIYSLSDPKAQPMQNISTARDISILAKYMFDHYEKQVTSITDMSTYSNPKRGFVKNNTNALLRIIPEVDGIKTGYTGNAGYCLAFSMKINKNEDNERDRRVIGVVLGANHKDKRISAAISMLDYAKNDFKSETLLQKGTLIGKRYIKKINDLEVTLVAEDEVYAVINKEENLKSQVTFKEITYPIKKGDVLGVIKYYTNNGDILGSVNIVSANDVDNVSFINKIKILFFE